MLGRKRTLSAVLVLVLALVVWRVVVQQRRDDMPLDQTPILEFPLRGEWRLVRSPGHDRYAFDLVALDPDTGRALKKTRLQHLLGRVSAQDFYSWAQPVYAPVGGRVILASDGWPDRERLHLLRDVAAMVFSPPQLSPDDIRPFAGNYVIIDADGTRVFMAHFKNGSVRVREGDRVATGQLIGEVGNSGFTLEPHLHFQLMDQVQDLATAKALPFRIRAYQRWAGRTWEQRQNAALTRGDRVRAAPE